MIMRLNRKPLNNDIATAVKAEKVKKQNKSASGKGKGSSFEREVAKKLSLWWSGGTRDDIFYRSHSSGARFTSRKKGGKDTAYQSGDITCSDPLGKPFIDFFSIECKTGYGGKGKKFGTLRWDLLDLLDSKQETPVLRGVWRQCQHDAKESNKTPLLIFRRNQRSTCVMMQRALFDLLTDFYGMPVAQIIQFGYYKIDYCILSFEDMIVWIPDGLGSFMQLERR
jgi:hypothetical protein